MGEGPLHLYTYERVEFSYRLKNDTLSIWIVLEGSYNVMAVYSAATEDRVCCCAVAIFVVYLYKSV